MKEEEFCPYCDEIVEFVFADDYYETAEGEEADVCKCPNCNKKVSVSWENKHRITFNKKEV
jgi:uncharacterized protein with PIN domain